MSREIVALAALALALALGCARPPGPTTSPEREPVTVDPAKIFGDPIAESP